MHILFITHDINSGGSARSLSVLVSELAKRHRITILSLQNPDVERGFLRLYQEIGVQFCSFGWGWLPINFVGCPMDFAHDKLLCEQQKPHLGPVQALTRTADVICFNGYPSTSLAAFLDKDLRKVLIAREVIDESASNFATVKAYLRRHINAAVAIGPVEARQLAAMGIPHTTVFNTSPQTPCFQPFPAAPPVHFGMFGQYLDAKGQHILLKGCVAAAQQLRAVSACVHLFGGPVPGPVTRFVQRFEIEDIVRLEGWVDNVEAHMAQMHCIVRPDQTGSPWGRDVIEAMSIGRPMLAAGTEEVFVKPGVTGWLVQPGDEAGLGLSMTLLAKNVKNLEKMGQNAFTFAREHFDPVRNAQQVEKILTDTHPAESAYKN